MIHRTFWICLLTVRTVILRFFYSVVLSLFSVVTAFLPLSFVCLLHELHNDFSSLTSSFSLTFVFLLISKVVKKISNELTGLISSVSRENGTASYLVKDFSAVTALRNNYSATRRPWKCTMQGLYHQWKYTLWKMFAKLLCEKYTYNTRNFCSLLKVLNW